MNKKNQVVCCVLAIIIVIIVAIIILCFGLRKTTPPVPDTCTYIVTVDENNNCFLIDGQKNKSLELKRGGKYKFEIDTPGHPFILTTSSKGGSLEGNIIMGTSEEWGLAEKGDFTLDLTDAPKREFYYQSLKGIGYGGKITVK